MRVKRHHLLLAFAVACAIAVAAAPDPAALAARLSDASARRRDEAARDLLALGRAAAPALEEAAASKDPEVRNRARALLALVTDENGANVRARLAQTTVRDALAAVEGLVAGSVHDVRIATLLPESGAVLASASRHVAERDFVSRDLACALARHATAATIAALADFVRDERVFPSGGLAAARELDRVLREAPERATAIRGDETALAALGEALVHRHPATRRVAVALYGPVAGESGATRLCEVAATDGDAPVRAECARVLGLYAPAQTARTLRRLAEDKDAQVREAALTALLEVPGVPHPEPAVVGAFDDVPAVRAAAARLLAREVTPETLHVLEALAQDRSDRVRAAAQRSLAAVRAR